jgi:hypothetical protein
VSDLSRHLLTCVDDVLMTGSFTTVAELSEDVHDNHDVDMWVRELPTGLLIDTPSAGIELPYPFTWTDFWQVVEELEQDG